MKKLLILSGITLNERNHFACSLTCENNFSVEKKCVQEYFQNMVLSIKAIIMQLYLGSAHLHSAARALALKSESVFSIISDGGEVASWLMCSSQDQVARDRALAGDIRHLKQQTSPV